MRDQETHHPQDGGFSRRNFLKGSSALAAATAISDRSAQADNNASTAPVYGPEARQVTLKINGKKQTVEVEPRVSLLSALRDHLDITGAKDACDSQQVCGSCTVMIDGKAQYACGILAVQAEGTEIQTVEGLGGSQPDPVCQAFVQHDAMQCGYCTPGFTVAVRALLNKNPDATLDEVQKGLGGNICRCGTYVGVTASALEVAKGGA